MSQFPDEAVGPLHQDSVFQDAAAGRSPGGYGHYTAGGIFRMLRKLCVAGEAASIIDGNSGKPGKTGLQILLYRQISSPCLVMNGKTEDSPGGIHYPFKAYGYPADFLFFQLSCFTGRKDQGRDIVHA